MEKEVSELKKYIKITKYIFIFKVDKINILKI